MGRTDTHTIETNAIALLQRAVVRDSTALWRTMSGRDYGIDGLIEFFDDGEATGCFMLVQVKGSQDDLKPQVRSRRVAAEINLTTLSYARQRNTPVLIVKVGLGNSSLCYGVLQDMDYEEMIRRASYNKTEKTTCYLEADNIVAETELDLGTRLWNVYQSLEWLRR